MILERRKLGFGIEQISICVWICFNRFLNLHCFTRDKSFSFRVFSCNTSLISCMFSCSHQSTFDRWYAREKKLYQEVRVHLKSSALLFEWCILSIPSSQGHDYSIEFQFIYFCCWNGVYLWSAAKRRSTQGPNQFKEIWSRVVSWMRQKYGKLTKDWNLPESIIYLFSSILLWHRWVVSYVDFLGGQGYGSVGIPWSRMASLWFLDYAF